ncbi:sulfurtransferase [Herbaspirillum sp. 1130]|uniref:sulfurtransferase n=1 Tax=Herbaspirillum sp. 1130 TaxID=2806562 RepID=UPI001AE9E8F0|nr:sulfurtransferase [Herbaspirillum sp. 1130]MBP1318294.1 thiosulfate/3-mercaptopyruvate sulfurtransferase [Herbaspirillum sp. 1130]
MPTSPLINSTELLHLQGTGAPLSIFDCTFDLSDHGKGRLQYEEEHIPGALFADMHLDLSAHDKEGVSGGRHPLPKPEDFAQWLRTKGVSNDSLVVVYDRNMQNFCVRLWWMLKWLGHSNVAVLDGGLKAWQENGGTTTSAIPRPATGNFSVRKGLLSLVDADQVLSKLNAPDTLLIDARAPARYAGAFEPIDSVGGHIPGAVNRPFVSNFLDNGTFKSPNVLQAEFSQLMNTDTKVVIHYCGSGVSATPNILAMELAGFGSPLLYAGSWSDWSNRADTPKEKSAHDYC